METVVKVYNDVNSGKIKIEDAEMYGQHLATYQQLKALELATSTRKESNLIIK